MTFQESIQVCFQRYADFHGMASRSEYWWFVLFIVLCGAVGAVLGHHLGAVFYLVTLFPSLAAATRRLHDTQRSGWWQLVCLIPLVGVVVLLVFLAQEDKAPAGDGV